MADATSSQRVPNPDHWVEHYMSNVNQELHSTMNTYEKQHARQEHANLAEMEDLFAAAMQKHREKLEVGGSESTEGSRVVECDCWEELAELVQEAEDEYKRQGGNAIRRLGRTVGDYTFALHGLAGLLPTNSNFSVVSAAVKLLFRAAGQRSAQRDKMLDELRKFLDVVADSAQSLRQFNEDQELRETAEALYVAMLRMIDACINSLVHESTWTKVKHAFVGDRPSSVRAVPLGDNVDHACAYFHHMQRQFNNRVAALTMIKITETASTTQRVAAHVIENVEPSVQRTENVTAKTYETTKYIEERGRLMDIEMRRVSSSVESHGDILLNIREMLCDILSNNEWQREAEERKSQTMSLRVEAYQLGLAQVRSLSPSDEPSQSQKKYSLWAIINVDPERCTEEARSMLRAGQGLSRAPAQVLKMYKNGRVREFLTSAASDAIFVQAILEGQEMSRCSSMSLASALLLQDLSGPHVAAIHYFCGAHNNTQDSLSGSIGIARVLIGQLLCIQEFDFTFLHAEWRAALDQGNKHALFALFEPLMTQLQVTTLFCVIDAITLFEGNTWKDDPPDALISELIRVATQCWTFVHLKLLVTSSSRSRIVGPQFQQGGHKGLVNLQLGGEEAEVSMKAVKLEVAKNRVRLSPSPGHSPCLLRPLSPHRVMSYP